MKKRFFYVAILSLLSLVSFGQGGYTPIPKLKITTTPDTNNSTTEVLVRDATTGNVGKVAKSSLVGTLDSVTDAGATTNNVISTGGVGINTTTPQAIFDVVSTTSGVLIPRMTTTQRDAIATPINSMLIYNSTNERFEYYKDAVWYSDEQGLQRVLEVGSSATLGDYTVDLGVLSGSDVVGFAFNYDNGTVFNEVSMTSGAILLQSSTAGKYGNLEITENADLNLVSGSGGNSTKVTFEDATETTTLKFPAKTSGEYTLATISDLETGYIPLTGTTTGKPVTGGIEVSYPDDFGGGYGKISMSEYGDMVAIKSLANTKEVTPEGFYGKNVLDEVITIVFDQNAGGLSSNYDFSQNSNELDFAQKKYVDNQRGKLIQLTTTEILALTPETGRLYYNTTINEVVFYNGTEWKKLSHSNM